MPIRRKPGEILEVDWAGSTLHVFDRDTGEKVKAYVFIATLPYSQYSYVEAFLDMKSANWLTAHIHAFEFLGGVTESIVPDNLKTGVISNKRTDIILNESYRELADFYKTVIIPARIRAPKDKPSVEGTVGFISRRIIAALRNSQCFTIQELNDLIKEKLTELNTESFQKRPGSRKKVYEEEESHYMLPLPHRPFKLSEWRTAKVQLNYHVQIDRMYYSVPYEYVQNQVDIRLTRGTIEIYFNEVRIASHKRSVGGTCAENVIGSFELIKDNNGYSCKHSNLDTSQLFLLSSMIIELVAIEVNMEQKQLVECLIDANDKISGHVHLNLGDIEL